MSDSGPPPSGYDDEARMQDPDGAMIRGAFHVSTILTMLSQGRYATEGLTFAERRKLFSAGGNVLKAFYDVMQHLQQRAHLEPEVAEQLRNLLFSLETSIDGLLLVEQTERDLHRQHDPT